MKTLIEVQKEINDLTEEAKLLSSYIDKRKINKIKARIKWLRLAVNYLSSDHNVDYPLQGLIIAKKRLENILKITPTELDRSSNNPEIKKKVREWDRVEGVDKLRGQIKFLNYLNS